MRAAVFILSLLSVPPAAALELFPVMVPMRDGVGLKTRVTIPGDGSGQYPVLLTRSPYNDSQLQWQLFGEYAKDGYALVVQNTRGSHGSEGLRFPFVPDGWNENQDGVDTVEWILAQPWCNGDVGLFGGSARGGLVHMLGVSNPRNVVAEWSHNAPSDFYGSVIYQGGTVRRVETREWFNALGPNVGFMVQTHPTYDAFWQSMDSNTRQAHRNRPLVISCGWYDYFIQSSLNAWEALQRDGGPKAKAESKLIVCMRGHGDNSGEFTWDPANTVPPAGYNYDSYFDYYLKGIENGYRDLPKVAYYLMGAWEEPGAPGHKWVFTDVYPPPHAPGTFYLHPDQHLRLAPPALSGQFSYVYDPLNPVPTRGGALYRQPLGTHDQRPIENRQDVILFETEPLTAPVEVVGRLWAHLYAASDALDTDFTAKLTDVYPDGRSIIISDGVLRARYRDGFESTSLMVPGTTYEFDIDMWSTAWVFNTGHRIRLAVSSSNYPKFELNPNTGVDFNWTYDAVQSAENTLHTGPMTPSRIVLPITGPHSDEDEVPDLLDRFPTDSTEHEDLDNDGMGDNFERRIVEDDAEDGLTAIEDVLSGDDYDGDGCSNLQEFLAGTDPLGDGAPGEGEGAPGIVHSSDLNGDNRIDLPELLRLIQLYNYNGFHCDASNPEDGYGLGPGPTECTPHSADYEIPHDFRFSLSELLRVIQLFNSGMFFPCGDACTDDGFCYE